VSRSCAWALPIIVPLAIGVRAEHPSIEFLFHESDDVMATGDVSSCILLEIAAGAAPPSLVEALD
jgi:hypothetical protein